MVTNMREGSLQHGQRAFLHGDPTCVDRRLFIRTKMVTLQRALCPRCIESVTALRNSQKAKDDNIHSYSYLSFLCLGTAKPKNPKISELFSRTAFEEINIQYTTMAMFHFPTRQACFTALEDSPMHPDEEASFATQRDDLCEICCNDYDEVEYVRTQLPCGHVYCLNCLKTHLTETGGQGGRCPYRCHPPLFPYSAPATQPFFVPATQDGRRYSFASFATDDEYDDDIDWAWDSGRFQRQPEYRRHWSPAPAGQRPAHGYALYFRIPQLYYDDEGRHPSPATLFGQHLPAGISEPPPGTPGLNNGLGDLGPLVTLDVPRHIYGCDHPAGTRLRFQRIYADNETPPPNGDSGARTPPEPPFNERVQDWISWARDMRANGWNIDEHLAAHGWSLEPGQLPVAGHFNWNLPPNTFRSDGTTLIVPPGDPPVDRPSSRPPPVYVSYETDFLFDDWNHFIMGPDGPLEFRLTRRLASMIVSNPGDEALLETARQLSERHEAEVAVEREEELRETTARARNEVQRNTADQARRRNEIAAEIEQGRSLGYTREDAPYLVAWARFLGLPLPQELAQQANAAHGLWYGQPASPRTPLSRSPRNPSSRLASRRGSLASPRSPSLASPLERLALSPRSPRGNPLSSVRSPRSSGIQSPRSAGIPSPRLRRTSLPQTSRRQLSQISPRISRSAGSATASRQSHISDDQGLRTGSLASRSSRVNSLGSPSRRVTFAPEMDDAAEEVMDDEQLYL
ncbi:hypothetical protein EJ08DRAFT_366521 [Tothia fuscella]|uniref:RING-type domain-containing protein n=1 Tax=Tothia fuscella TaxID=1048955 RepID=A0A9P4NLU8_9PEZI|nr:hypothetical protein EJ08DRAFT_366521 [Tothia fuscella]